MPPKDSWRHQTPGLVALAAAGLVMPLVVAYVAGGYEDEMSPLSPVNGRPVAQSAPEPARAAAGGQGGGSTAEGASHSSSSSSDSLSLVPPGPGTSTGSQPTGSQQTAAQPTGAATTTKVTTTSTPAAASTTTTTTTTTTTAAAPTSVLLNGTSTVTVPAPTTSTVTVTVTVTASPTCLFLTSTVPNLLQPGSAITSGPCPTSTTTAAPTTSSSTTGPSSSTSYGPTSGWHSGASGDSAASGAFGTFRGKPIQVTAVWGDTTAEEQSQVNALDAYDTFDGDVDVAIGGLVKGDTWAQAAQGAYVERWRTAIRKIASKRSSKPGTVYVRFAHELNGDWFDWKVTPSDVTSFKTAWKLYHDLLKQEYPAAKLVFSPNSGSSTNVPISEMYPGDDLVDVIGVDFYDGWPSVTDAAGWAANLDTMQGANPYGVGAWQKFAASHGKPLAFPEWGLRAGDHPAFIQGMHDFLAQHAAHPGDTDLGGKIVYDVYFDIANGGNSDFMITGGHNPQAAALYRTLAWGV